MGCTGLRDGWMLTFGFWGVDTSALFTRGRYENQGR
jgi:hypothetical protein